MLWLCSTLTSLGSTLHKMESMVMCQVAQCWDKAANKTELVPALEGLTEQRENQSRPQTRQLQCREMRVVPREAPGGSGSTEGHLAQPWREGLWLFYSLLSMVPHTCWGQECVLNDRVTTGLSPISVSRSSSGRAHLLDTSLDHSVTIATGALVIPFPAPPGQGPV